MKKQDTISTYTAQELKAMLAKGEDRSDWAASAAMSQAEVARLADEDDGPLPADWAKHVFLGLPSSKKGVFIRIDDDVLQWFRNHGRGYQTRMNAVLKAFVEAKKKESEDIRR